MKDIKVYTLEEIADMLHITRRSLYTYIKEGRLKAVKIGKYWRVTQENLEDFLLTGTKGVTVRDRKPQNEDA